MPVRSAVSVCSSVAGIGKSVTRSAWILVQERKECVETPARVVVCKESGAEAQRVQRPPSRLLMPDAQCEGAEQARRYVRKVAKMRGRLVEWLQ